MLRNIRKIGYTLLSRHFYVGLGLGFFFASLFFASQALASEVTLFSNNNSSSGLIFNNFPAQPDNGTSTIVFNVNTGYFGTTTATYVSRITLLTSAFGDEVVQFRLADNSGNWLFASRTASVLDSTHWQLNFNDTEYTASNCSTNCKLYVSSSKGYGVWKSSVNETSIQRNTNSFTPSAVILGSSTPAEPEPQMLNYSFTIGNVASTSCVGTSTTAICTHYYYPNVTEVTPTNLFVLFLTFILSFSGTYWIIRKLT